MNDIFGHPTGMGLKFLNNFIAQTKEKRSQRRAKDVFFFFEFFDSLWPHLILITTKTV